MMKKHLAGQGGWSLFEMLVVLVVISLCWLGLQSGSLEHFSSEWRCRLFCQDLAQALRLSQMRAISQQAIYRVVFESGTNQVVMDALGQAGTRCVYPLPSHWKLVTFLQFHYFPDGRTERFKTVYFLDVRTQKRHRVRFQFGSGRFEMD